MPLQVATDTDREAAAATSVIVGELLSIEPLPDPCEAEHRRTGELSCISMDSLYRAKYRVVLPVVGGQQDSTVEFQISDHYGFPGFARHPHALLFLASDGEGTWLHKYQGVPLFRTRDGDWAACGDMYRKEVHPTLANRARPLRFAGPIAKSGALPRAEWRQQLAYWREDPATYWISDDGIWCRKGIVLPEVYELVRLGTLAARGIALPPWPGSAESGDSGPAPTQPSQPR